MRIFVTYRRDDSLSITGRIDDHLRKEFGTEEVYRDIESTPLGVDFAEHINRELENCDVVIAIIGQRWASRRLANDRDFVRLELETAMRRGVPVIPVLVEGATLPKAKQLPPSLQPLLRRNAVVIDSGSDFGTHFKRLATGIRDSRATRQAALDISPGSLEKNWPVQPLVIAETPPTRWSPIAKALVGFALIGLLLAVFLARTPARSLERASHPVAGAPAVDKPPEPDAQSNTVNHGGQGVVPSAAPVLLSAEPNAVTLASQSPPPPVGEVRKPPQTKPANPKAAKPPVVVGRSNCIAGVCNDP